MSELLRVLLVEDNPGDADLIRELLPRDGPVSFEVTHAQRLATAVELVAAGHFDLVLLDLGLPDSAGLDTVRAMRQQAPDLPIVVLTGNDDEQMGLAAIQAGAQEYVVKGQITGAFLSRVIRYAQERFQIMLRLRESEERLRIGRDVLHRLNHPGSSADTVRDILEMIKADTGFEAVGIRLAEGEDFPYYEAIGFSDHFVQAERFLCDRDDAGEVSRDIHGTAVLACMCGNILRGRTDPKLPFFTAGGSFWTNCTTDLLASTTEEDRLGPTRNRCNSEGYESVALIPLRSGKESIGLLQFNDRRRDRFTSETIGFFEGLAASIGIALARKRAVEALQESEERLRLTLDAVNDGVWDWHVPSGRAVFSPHWYDMLGYEPNEFASSYDSWRSLVHPDEIDRVENEIEAHVASGDAIAIEMRMRTKSGDWRWVLTRGRVIEREGDGSPIRLVGTHSDITERKLAEEALQSSEERYRQLFELESDALILVDNETGQIQEVNVAAMSLYGYSREEWLSMNHAEVSIEPEKTRQAAMERLSQVPLRWHKKKDGTVFPAEITGRHFDWKGRSVHIAAIRDITQRIEAERDLRERDHQLRQAQKMEAVGQLAGGIAHDFNNLLTAIIGYSDLLLARQELTDSPVREDLVEIRRAAERATALTRQILAFSRRQTLQPTVVSLNDVLAGIEPLLRRTLGEDVDLVSVQDPALGHVEVDVHQFEQVLMNLALNARDAMVSGGRLTLETANVELDEKYCRAHPEANPGSCVMLAVSDTGAGMDDATMERIFEPFFTTKGVGQGTGLGLATVYGTLRQSNGSISVYSEVGKGTSFKIYLPRTTAAVQEETRATTGAALAGGHEIILVVEDEESLRNLVARVLRGLGYRVLSAGTAAEALEVAKESDCKLDLLLTDVVLPGGVQGNELAGNLCISVPDLPVLYMSGYTRKAVVHAGRLDPGVNFLEKPFTPAALASMVRRVLDQARPSG